MKTSRKSTKNIKSTTALLAISASILSAEDSRAGSLDGGRATGSNGAIAIGNQAHASGTSAVALGNGATASHHSATAIGVDAKATALMSTALGPKAHAAGVFSTALGLNSIASGMNSVALGAGSTATDLNTVAVGSATTRRTITHMAAGRGDTDAANVGQLRGIAAGLGGGASVSADGTVSAPTYTVGGTTVNSVGNAITSLDGHIATVDGRVSTVDNRVTTVDGRVSTVDGRVTTVNDRVTTVDNRVAAVDGRVTTVDNRVTNVEGSVAQVTNRINRGAVGLVRQDGAAGDVNVAATQGGTVMNVAGTDGARLLTGVADGVIGAGSTDAINGSQIHSLAERLAKTGGVGVYFQAVGRYGGSAEAASVRPDSGGMAAGSAAEASGDGAVALGADARALGDNSVALGAGSVADRADTVSVGAADAERQIANVAAGTEDTDAVNLGQMRNHTGQSNSQTLIQANTYASRLVGAVRRDAHAGTASAMAMAGLPQSVRPGKGMASMGASGYSGESAIALGVSKMSSSGKWVYKAIVSSNTRGNYGSTVSAGFHW